MSDLNSLNSAHLNIKEASSKRYNELICS